MEYYSTGSVTENEMSLKIEGHSKYNVTQMKCHSKWNVTQV